METRVTVTGVEGNGIVIGERHYTTVVIRQLNAAELIAAAEAGEVLKIMPGAGAILVHSAVVTLRERICRSVARLETADGQEHPGPLNKSFLANFSSTDYDRLIDAMDEIDAAAAGAAKRGAELGRNEGAGGET